MILALAGCGSGDGAASASASEPVSTAASTSTAAAGEQSTASSDPTEEPDGAASPRATTPASTGSTGTAAASTLNSQAGAAQTGTTACATDSLSAEVAPAAGGGAAGSYYWNVTLTNTGSSDCTLTGFPGVSFADASGAQVGEPAEREPADGSVVTLTPGASAAAPLRVTDPGVLGGCTAVTATSVVIYPPDQTKSLTATANVQVCQEQASTTVGVLQAVS